MKFFYYLLRAILYIPTKIIFPVKVHNKKQFPKKKKIIIVSNHLCWRDALIVAINFPGYRHFLGKKELGKNPIVRFIGHIAGVIFVERGKSDLSSMRSVVTKLKKGHGLTLFPEGTRNKVDTSLQEIKSGIVMFSVRGDAPILPIYIDRPAKPFRRTNICVGELFDIVDSDKKILNSNIIKEKVEVVTEKMSAVKEEMDKIQQAKDDKKKSKKETKKSKRSEIKN